MSIRAIVLCTVLFDWAADVSLCSDAFEVTHHNAVQAINATVFKAHEAFKVGWENDREMGKNFSVIANEFSQKFQNAIQSIVKTIGARINYFATKANGVNISDCSHYSGYIHETAKKALIDTGACIADRLKIGLDYIVNMDKLFKDELVRLTASWEMAQRCDDNSNDVNVAIESTSCIKVVRSKVKRIFSSFVEKLADSNVTLNFLLKSFRPYLAYCQSSGLVTFHHQSLFAMRKANKCIRRKIDEAGTPVTKKINVELQSNESELIEE